MSDISAKTLRQRMDATGIGFAGLDGVWWLLARKPFSLSNMMVSELEEISRSLFNLFDTVTRLYRQGASDRLNHLMEYKVPENIPRLLGLGRVDSLRPDFQLCPSSLASGSYRPVVTELEMCPSAHGFAHAMQLGYGLELDLVNSFAHYLDGRELLFVGTQYWSEFLFEQLAFCRALTEAGGRGRVLYDLPIATIAGEVRHDRRWSPPIFGISKKPGWWNDDVMGRIQARDLEPYIWPDKRWPIDVGDAVVFRFGYLECFSPSRLGQLRQWQESGATILNPLHYFLDSKTIMAALNLPDVRQNIGYEYLAVLDECIPETLLITEESEERILNEKDCWVVKYAGYDGDNQSWGGRSVEMGAHHSQVSWRKVLARYLALPWPTVAQHVVPTAKINIDFVDENDNNGVMVDGHTRLRAFMLRHGEKVGGWNLVCGSHVTVSATSARVSEGLNTVQAPVTFLSDRPGSKT